MELNQIARPEMPGPDSYDFYRCSKCNRLLTRPEELAAFKTGKLCPCGSMRYEPCDMRWYHWLLPRVLKFVWERYHGRA